jgi:hypothetical protein
MSVDLWVDSGYRGIRVLGTRVLGYRGQDRRSKKEKGKNIGRFWNGFPLKACGNDGI